MKVNNIKNISKTINLLDKRITNLLIQKEIDEVFVTVSSWSREYADHNEEFISFKQRKS